MAFSIIGLASVATVVLGIRKDKLDALEQQREIALYNQQQAQAVKEAVARAVHIRAITTIVLKSKQNRTVQEDLQYLGLTGTTPVVSFLGSSVTYGTGSSNGGWVADTVAYLRGMDGLQNLRYFNDGAPGKDTRQIMSGGYVQKVIAQKPNVVFFEDCIINDREQSEALKETLQRIPEIVAELKAGIPGVRIILLSPDPIEKQGPNLKGFTYQDYFTQTTNLIKSYGWDYIDVYNGLETQMRAQKLTLAQILNSDGIHPNDTGYTMWFNLVKQYISTKQ